jgi:hypothetical protein
MSVLQALPFKVANGAIELEIGQLPDDVHVRTDNTLDAYSDVSGAFTLTLTVKVDREGLTACLPTGAGDLNSLVEICVASRSTLSRSRVEVAAGPPEDAVYEVPLDRAQHMGRVDLVVVARLRKGLEPTPGFAHLKGSTLAQRIVAGIWFDEPPTFSGDSLDIRWVDFDADTPTGKLLHDGHIFAIELKDRPVILLNEAESVSPLRAVLENRGTHGRMARARDAVFQQIVHQAWTSIIGHCFLEVLQYGDEDAETVLDGLGDWQAAVIRAWGRDFVPEEQDIEAAAKTLIDRVREPGNEMLLVAAPALIQERFQTMKGFLGLAKEGF